MAFVRYCGRTPILLWSAKFAIMKQRKLPCTLRLPGISCFHPFTQTTRRLLYLVFAQRLVRKICTACIGSIPATPEIQKLIGAQIAIGGYGHISKIPKVLFVGSGCKVCGKTGFRGQVGIFEVFRVTEAVRALL